MTSRFVMSGGSLRLRAAYARRSDPPGPIRPTKEMYKAHNIRQQMIVCGILAHLTSIVRRNHATVAKGEPFREAIK